MPRWIVLVAVVVCACALSSTAYATPTFLSAINISDAGQDAFEPQVAVENSSGNVHAVWTRSDGTNLRIQYSTRTPNGSWSAPINISDPGQSASEPDVDVDGTGNILVVWSRSDGTNLRIQATYKQVGGSFAVPTTISDPGRDATAPQIDFDNSGKALAVWSRHDGSSDICCLRVQASVRQGGAGGTFSNEVTLSAAGQDGYEAALSAGPNVDANGVIAWTRSDGTKLRVQSARRRDVTGFPRPKAAGTARLAMVPAYNACPPASSNRQHGPSLNYSSCAPPVRSSSVLTVGTPDVNTFTANSVSSVRWRAVVGNTATETNEADVQAVVKIDDVRTATGALDYTGPIGIRTALRITDNRNASEQPEPGTGDVTLEFPVQCVATTTDTSRGSNCNATTSINALLPGAVQEIRRSIWEIGQTVVRDAGPNGTGYASCPTTCGDGDEGTFLRQGVFVP